MSLELGTSGRLFRYDHTQVPKHVGFLILALGVGELRSEQLSGVRVWKALPSGIAPKLCMRVDANLLIGTCLLTSCVGR